DDNFTLAAPPDQNIEREMITNQVADGGYSPAAPTDTGHDHSGRLPGDVTYTMPEVTIEGKPSSTYTMPDVTVEGEPNPWVDRVTGAETNPMTGTVTFPDDHI